MSTAELQTQINKVSGLIHSTSKEVESSELKKGEKYLLLRSLMQGIKPAQKIFENLEKDFKYFAKQNLIDLGDGKSDKVEYEGVELSIKYTYVKPRLDSEKLKEDLVNAFAEIGDEYHEEEYLTEPQQRQTVVIENVFKK